MVNINVRKNNASREYLDICWDTFFKSKNRGLDLHVHFPWLTSESSSFFSYEAEKNNQIVGGLIVLKRDIRNLKIGLVGLVCIKEEYRGQGIFKALMRKMQISCIESHFSALYLWSSKHSIYEKFDFELHDKNILAKIKIINDGDSRESIFHPYESVNIIRRTDLAVPPFASGVYELKTGSGSIVYCEGYGGKYIISHENTIENAIFEFGKLSKDVFFLNAVIDQESDILSVKEHFDVEIIKQNIQMVNVIDKANIDKVYKINFLVNERI
ncbi:GNAT family N-acetyltransferase [Escherichia albertii]|uniref:Predicted acetyltransferase n=1 Tax=Escherichia albertii TaxID=208962 RepID=A0A5A4U6V8_ESCAL|nr:GNAT family N-acetyltransferase [Escherichia albertii]BBM62554.1 predicted acetyltransferase [Escherichia albertii]